MKKKIEIEKRLAAMEVAHAKDFSSQRLKAEYPHEYAYQKGCINMLKWVLRSSPR